MIGFRTPQPPPKPVERVAWTLTKTGRRVALVLRQHPLGTEVRCVYRDDLLWSEAFKARLGHPPAVQGLLITRGRRG